MRHIRVCRIDSMSQLSSAYLIDSGLQPLNGQHFHLICNFALSSSQNTKIPGLEASKHISWQTFSKHCQHPTYTQPMLIIHVHTLMIETSRSINAIYDPSLTQLSKTLTFLARNSNFCSGSSRRGSIPAISYVYTCK